MENLKKYYILHPLRSALFLGLLLRLIAVVFSKGFGMHDDHFLVIEVAQSWADGTDYNNWLPGSGTTQPSGHSFFYCGLHYILFSFLQTLGIFNPELKMLIVRLIHALLSLFTIWFGFKITARLSNVQAAGKAAMLLAVLWFMPFLSVRNLVEVVCIPFLAASVWYAMDAPNRTNHLKWFLVAGLLGGLAFNIRFQSLFFISGIGMSILLKMKWKECLYFGGGVLFSFGLIQGVVDFLIWGKPFVEFVAYIQYNIDNAYNYITNPWYNYLLLIFGILIPPISIFLFVFMFKNFRKQTVVVLPILIFLIFHSYFPNKQERFIIPIVPFIVMVGMAGMHSFFENRPLNSSLRKFLYGSWIFFWVLNFTLLPFITTMYSKKARVESMIYLSKYKENINYLLLEDTNHGTPKMPPEFYLGKWVGCYELSKDQSLDTLKSKLLRYGKQNHPDFVLFFEDKNLVKRVATVKSIFPGLKFETTISPGFIDDILFRLNPKNANQVIYIFRVNENS
ncbi:MAG: glycosyltransferase family 39 protein [Bacteroidetes bacterium]|nr:glycosyltransferase family 39 protein [Bacteroidota bacterium]